MGLSVLSVDVNKVFLAPLSAISREEFSPGPFDCGDTDYNDYLTDGTAFNDEDNRVTRTYLAITEEDNLGLVGYVSVLNDSIKLNTSERTRESVPYNFAPAIKIGRLAVDKRCQGCGVGARLIYSVFGLAEYLSRSSGIRYVTLDALPQRVSYYEGFGFVKNKQVHKDYRALRNVDLVNTSMRFDLQKYQPSGMPSLGEPWL